MAIKKDQVFLVSGQMKLTGVDQNRLSPDVMQRVVIAQDDQAAYQLLEKAEPAFIPVGHATLQQYEEVAAKLRATLKGDATGWSVLVAPEMAL